MKNLRISQKIGIVISIILLIGISILYSLSNRNMINTLTTTTSNRMQENAKDRSAIVDHYISTAEAFLKSYAQGYELTVALKNSSSENKEFAQKYTEKFAALNNNIENVYLATTDSTVISSMVTSAIGITLRKGDDLKNLMDGIQNANGVYNVGIIISKSTGDLVMSMYYPIYDGDTLLGFAGMAMRANELLSILDSLEFVNMKECSYELLDVKTNKYICTENSELNGTEITDEATLQLLKKIDINKNEDICFEEDIKISNKTNIAVCNYISKRGYLFLIKAEKDEVYSNVRSTSEFLLIVCILVFLLSVLSVIIISNMISKDFKSIDKIIINMGNLNLTEDEALRPYEIRKDEVGIIAKGMLLLVTAVKQVILRLKNEIIHLNETAIKLEETSDKNVAYMNQVETTIHEIAQGAACQADETQRATKNIYVIGTMIEGIVSEADILQENSFALKDACNKGMSTVHILNEVNKSTEESVNRIAVQTSTTNESVRKIQNAVSYISSIAEETSLLSLNASIEAARAGEQGKGFSVVASQIKKLAEQSNSSAADITAIIDSLIQDSDHAVEAVEEVKKNIEAQSMQVKDTLEVFEVMRDKSDASVSGIDKMKIKTDQINNARKEVIEVVNNLSAISQENAASVQETSASITEVNGIMNDIKDSAKALSEVSQSINSGIDCFLIEDYCNEEERIIKM